jgi:surface protein
LISDNGTIKYTGSAALVPTSTPLFIRASPRGIGFGIEWFAVVKQDMKGAIIDYAWGDNIGLFISPEQTLVTWNNIVTTLMTDMNRLFSFNTTFNQPIRSWDTSNVRDMGLLFTNAGAFNQNIDLWNTSMVENMDSMFYSAYQFNQPIVSWNTSNVRNMSGMFGWNLFNQPIGSWNTSNVTNMSSMFIFNRVFNQPIGSWNTSNVSNMSDMFHTATAFNQNISGWDVDQVTNFYLFKYEAFLLSYENTPPRFR